ncbi:MAG: OmpA family protein [Hydrogenophaga sp.]|uniref:OmpA family protein n=1 Tax=Hydrogenophaga sp. TaxID=1904254 RepID=UPI002745AE70|nr:OmpA family protein [Hydrogenophaga sp.]MDP2416732.1 OmpA family protein [Hydrogenophaga sp.]MDZ4189455.1 OmpA family protein [Hydrogenophaga sp.]
MQRPLALWQKLFVSLVTVSFLPACSSLNTLWNKTVSAPQSDAIIFSHAEPQTPTQRATHSLSNAWSPTQWTQVTSQPLPNPLSLIAPAPAAAKTLAPPALTVYFDNDRDILNPNELERLKSFASNLTLGQPGRLEVTGHTDSNQTAAYNLALSKRRAETVRQWLVQLGIPEAHVVLGWHGLRFPASSNDTEEGRATNRRVEIKQIPG